MPKTEKGKACSIPRMLGIAVLLLIIGQVVHTIEAMLTMDYYMDAAYFQVWSRLMMPIEGPPPTEFYYASLLIGFIAAIIYVWFYHFIRPVLADGSWVRKGACFGLVLFFVSTVPGMLTLFLLINLPVMLIVAWAVSGLIISLLDGLVLAKFC